MTVIINKPGFNLRETLTSLKRKIGIKGAELMAAETVSDVYSVIGTNRNLIINGSFDVWQRGTSFSSGTQYTADRWYSYQTGSFAQSLTKSSLTEHGYAAEVLSNATSGYAMIAQVVENSSQLKGTYTLSFYIKSTGTGNVRIEFRQNTSSTTIWQDVAYTTVSTGWQRVTKTIYLSETDNIRILIGVATGTPGATVSITKVQFELGSVATPFEHRPYGTELALCQRYLTVFGTPANNQYVHLGIATLYTATAINLAVALPVSMRTTPSLTTVLNGSSVWLQTYIGASGINSNAIVATGEYLSVGSNTIRLYCTGAYSGGTVGQSAWCQVMNGAQLQFIAEL